MHAPESRPVQGETVDFGMRGWQRSSLNLLAIRHHDGVHTVVKVSSSSTERRGEGNGMRWLRDDWTAGAMATRRGAESAGDDYATGL